MEGQERAGTGGSGSGWIAKIVILPVHTLISQNLGRHTKKMGPSLGITLITHEVSRENEWHCESECTNAPTRFPAPVTKKKEEHEAKISRKKKKTFNTNLTRVETMEL